MSWLLAVLPSHEWTQPGTAACWGLPRIAAVAQGPGLVPVSEAFPRSKRADRLQVRAVLLRDREKSWTLKAVDVSPKDPEVTMGVT